MYKTLFETVFVVNVFILFFLFVDQFMFLAFLVSVCRL